MIHRASQDDLTSLHEIAHNMGAAKVTDYFEIVLNKQTEGTLTLYMADDQAYVILNEQPKYGFYKRLGIPEIQDLNVIPSARRQGLGESLVRHCETVAKDKGYDQIGISVGLHRGFGAAQRLYARMSYIPDGNGVTYDRNPVQSGEFKCVDDDLCLMMLKDLR